MADLITIKSGAIGDRETMPNLNVDELGYRTDTKELYIGTEAGNERLCGVNDAKRIKNLEAKIAEIEGHIATTTAHLVELTPSE